MHTHVCPSNLSREAPMHICFSSMLLIKASHQGFSSRHLIRASQDVSFIIRMPKKRKGFSSRHLIRASQDRSIPSTRLPTSHPQASTSKGYQSYQRNTQPTWAGHYYFLLQRSPLCNAPALAISSIESKLQGTSASLADTYK